MLMYSVYYMHMGARAPTVCYTTSHVITVPSIVKSSHRMDT